MFNLLEVLAFVFLAALFSFIVGYWQGKKSLLEILKLHVFGGLSSGQAILYEDDIFNGRVPDYRHNVR